MSFRAVSLPLLAVAGLALAGCSLADDGPPTTQTRSVARFTRIENPGAVDVHVRVGERQHVTVHAGRSVIGDVRTEVRDGTLRVQYSHHGFGGNHVTLDVTVPSLTAIDASGSGDVDAAGIRADAFSVRSDGSGDVALSGQVQRLEVDVSGSGDTKLSKLVARDAQVSDHGSGDADVNAVERLSVELDGSGDVHYHGRPMLTRSDNGSGDITS